MKRLLITGSAGFIAQHLILEAMRGKWYVIGVDKRPQYFQADHFIQADIKDLNYRDLMGVDAVVHLAWRTNIGDCIRHPEASTHDNINMTLHLLEVCREAKIPKVIFPTTASLYSFNKTPWTEDMSPEPIEYYSWQKLACEFLCKMYSAQFSLPTVILRLFQVYGERQREDTVISVFNKLKKENKEATLMDMGKKRTGERDFVHAQDVAKAMLLAVKSKNVGKGEIINICSGKLTTIEEVVQAMEMKYKWVEKRGHEVDRHLGDNKKARLLLGWSPTIDVLQWLKEKKYDEV